jgi:Flp pilus assembly protein TadG
MMDTENSRRPDQKLRRFFRDENGSYTLEFVIWMPMFAILLAIVMNLSMVFYYESQMLRVTQDATRAYSLGRFIESAENGTAEAQAAQYIQANLNFIGAPLDVQVSTVGSVAQAIVTANAAEMMPFSLMSAPFQLVEVGIMSQYIIEF